MNRLARTPEPTKGLVNYKRFNSKKFFGNNLEDEVEKYE